MTNNRHNITPVREALLVDQICRQLRHMILSGSVTAGMRLVELEIATQMGTSQGPVREALHRLERDGLVERRSRRGTFVTDVSLDEIREIFAVRELLEGFAARNTARLITSEQVDELEALIEQMRLAGRAGDIVALTDGDLEFHRRICLWSERPALLRAWMPLYTQVQRFIAITHPHYFNTLEDIAETHEPILAALRAHAPEQAVECIREHMALIWARIQSDPAGPAAQP